MNILTFDIEEWFHILDNDSTRSQGDWARYEHRIQANADRLMELLEKNNQKATFFCLGWIAEKYPDIVKKIDIAGYEIGSHSYGHQLAYDQSRTEYREDLIRSIKLLEDITGKKVKSYRAPGFSFTKENIWTFDILLENGIEYDSSVFPMQRAHGGFINFGESNPLIIERQGMQLKEFPINIYSFLGRNVVFSGGGYFRLCPYWMIKRMMKLSPYVMTYFHPRDFDAKQPMIKELPLVRKFKSYYGLASSYQKLSKLITEFEFIDLETANMMMNWNTAKHMAI